MKKSRNVCLGSVLLCSTVGLWSGPALTNGWAGTESGSPAAKGESRKSVEADQQEEAPQARLVRMPKFTPPKRGAPVGRIAGGARGAADGELTLVALAPELTALAATRSPTVYWYTSEVPPWPVELTVTEPRAVTPLLVRRLATPATAGIQRVSLEELGGRLEANRDYRWYISLVRDDERRSRDLLAFGGVRWEAPTREFLTAVDGASPGDVPGQYAAAGYWYEALDAAIRLEESEAYRAAAIAARSDLLEQVGLGEIVPSAGTE